MWQTGWQTDRLTDRQADRQTAGYACLRKVWQTDRLTDRQAYRRTAWHADLRTGGQTDILTCWPTDRQTADLRTGWQTFRLTDGQADRRPDRVTNGQRDRWTYWICFLNCIYVKQSYLLFCLIDNITRMTTFIKMKFNKSDDQTNIDNIELLLILN